MIKVAGGNLTDPAYGRNMSASLSFIEHCQLLGNGSREKVRREPFVALAGIS
jgi:hypothetical protein